jgi:RNA polymerase-interacting CarD/CdnL/TRCF family regulator
VRKLNLPHVIDTALADYAVSVMQQRYNDLDIIPIVWSKRQKDYQSRLQAGDFVGVLGIYQELSYIGQHKDLSFGEKTLLQTTEEILSQEMMIVKNIDRSAALECIRAPFKQFIGQYATSQYGSANSAS